MESTYKGLIEQKKTIESGMSKDIIHEEKFRIKGGTLLTGEWLKSTLPKNLMYRKSLYIGEYITVRIREDHGTDNDYITLTANYKGNRYQRNYKRKFLEPTDRGLISRCARFQRDIMNGHFDKA